MPVCPLFVALLPSGFLGEITCRLARSLVPPLHRISISVFHSIAPSHLRSLPDAAAASPSVLVVCVCVCCGLSPPLRIRPRRLSHPPARRSPTCTREKEWRETSVARDGKSRHPSTANPSFLSGKSSVARRGESPSAHGARSERAARIKLEPQRMIGQSLTRLRLFYPSTFLANDAPERKHSRGECAV